MEDIIYRKLMEIEEKEQVKIILAVESGSRAWGFASPDSDYDVRFIYVRKQADYLKLEKVRDVIEWQLDDVLDINGWDLKKALQLIHKSNPSIYEWLASPIVYKSSEEFFELKEIAKQYFSPKKSLYHYWHMASSNYREYLKEDEVKIKKYFYVLRPLLAARWVIDKRTQPPMRFTELIEAELPFELKGIVFELLDKKRKLPEMGLAPKIEELNIFIEDELEAIKNAADTEDDIKRCWNLLDDYFVKHIEL